MYTDKQIQETARTLLASGKKPTIRAVRAKLGGGDPGRIAKILREMTLRLSNYSTKEMDKLCQRIEDMNKTISILQAQNEALHRALASREKNYRASKMGQLNEFINTIENHDKENIINVKNPDRFIFSNDIFYVPVRKSDGKAKLIDGVTHRKIYSKKTSELTPAQLEWRRRKQSERMKRKRERRDHALGIPDVLRKVRREQVYIDGMSNAEILHSKRVDLTPDQLEWCRQYEREGRERTLLRKKYKILIEEKGMSIREATKVINALFGK